MTKKKVMVECQLDTAATCNVLSWRDYVVLGKPALENSGTTLVIVMYDGSVRKSLGWLSFASRRGRAEGQKLILQGDEKQPPFTLVIGHMSDPKSSQLQSICHPGRAESHQTAGVRHMEKSTDTKVAVCKFLDFIPRYVP